MSTDHNARPVLVAGGAGYIGSHTVRALEERGVPVVVLDDLSAGHREALRAPLEVCGWVTRRVWSVSSRSTIRAR